MISFYPGPSKLYPQVSGLMQEAAKTGVLSINHRSAEFVKISKTAIQLLKKKIHIPSSYQIFFTSSATESWEIIAQSLTNKSSIHIYNGAFGEKWYEYTRQLNANAQAIPFNFNETIPEVKNREGVVCIVQNETSNGTQISNKNIASLKKSNPDALIAIDATSSLGGIKLDIKNGDIWLASVQKCLGLPAGMGLLICSPKAIQKAVEINEKAHYNSLTFMIEKMKDWQTSYTPNVLSIFLLMKILNKVPNITDTDFIIKKRAKNWYAFIQKFKTVKPLIISGFLQSDTVITVEGDEKIIKTIKAKAKKAGFLLGNGYGKWSKNTFRIANFPALTEKEIKALQNFMKANIK